LVARSFANHHALRAESSETLDRGGHEERMRVDVVSGDVIDEVWFEKNSLASNVQMEQIQTRKQNLPQGLRIRFGAEDSHPGPRLFSVDAVLGFL
jgi:hypothetical protein